MALDPIVRIPPVAYRPVSVPLAETRDWWFARTRMAEAHKRTKGEGVTIAVLDTGFDDGHPDLEGALIDAVDITRERDPRDFNGHGTACLVMAGGRENDRGVVGPAPLAKLISVKVMDSNGAGLDSDTAKGLIYAVDRGADIASMSFGSSVISPAMAEAISYANSRNVLLIAAAGNDGRRDSVNWPAKHEHVAAIGAYDKHGNLADFSSRGPQVLVCGPGVDVLSGAPGHAYRLWSGTSFACPWMSGYAALLVAWHRKTGIAHASPLRTNAELQEHLKAAAEDAGIPGRDTGFGWGPVFADHLGKDDAETPATIPIVRSPCLAEAPLSALLKEIWRRVRGKGAA